MRQCTRGGGVVVLLLAIGLLAWPALATAQAIKVGAVVPLTGRYAALGSQVRPGYEIAVEHINEAGGVTLGGSKRPLELVLLDDEVPQGLKRADARYTCSLASLGQPSASIQVCILIPHFRTEDGRRKTGHFVFRLPSSVKQT